MSHAWTRDALDRLVESQRVTSWATNPPTTATLESYAYNQIGNMTSKAGVTITNGTAKPGVISTLRFEAYSVYSPTDPGGSFVTPQTFGSWSFEGNAGVSYNNTHLTNGNPAAPEGMQVGFIQGTARMTATVSGFTIGQTYRIGFMMAQRVNYGLPQTVTVWAGNAALGTFVAWTGAYGQKWSEPFTATATSQAIALWGAPDNGEDRTAFIDRVVVATAGPHAAVSMGDGNSYEYDPNGNMLVRREMSGTQAFVYTQTWTVDNRLASVTKTDVTGTVLAVTTYAYDGDGARVRKDDPDGIVLYVGATEAVIGAPGTDAIEYYDDTQAGTFSFLNYTKTVVSATTGISYAWGATPPLAGMGDAPWALRWNQWVSVTQAGLYTVTAIADDGVGVSIAGVSVIYSLSIRDTGPLTAGVGVYMAPGNVYQLQVSYLNYTSTNGASFRLMWTRPDGVTEDIPASALRARSRRDYYSFGGAVVAMKEGVTSAPRVLSYLHGDHLGSASLTTNISGTVVSQQRYKPYGEVRWSSGAGLPTDFSFTGQRAGGYGTIFMSAREYWPSLGRFLSADSIVPGAGNPQAFNR